MACIWKTCIFRLNIAVPVQGNSCSVIWLAWRAIPVAAALSGAYSIGTSQRSSFIAVSAPARKMNGCVTVSREMPCCILPISMPRTCSTSRACRAKADKDAIPLPGLTAQGWVDQLPLSTLAPREGLQPRLIAPHMAHAEVHMRIVFVQGGNDGVLAVACVARQGRRQFGGGQGRALRVAQRVDVDGPPLLDHAQFTIAQAHQSAGRIFTQDGHELLGQHRVDGQVLVEEKLLQRLVGQDGA